MEAIIRLAVKVIFSLAFCSFSILAFAAEYPRNEPIDPARNGRDAREYTVQPVKQAKKIETYKMEAKPALAKKVPEATFQLNKIVIVGATEYTPKTLEKLYKPYIGKKVTFSNLQDIAYAITNQYREEGYILTKAIIPAQKITNGVVQIRVIEGFIDQITVEGSITKGVRASVERYGQKIKDLWLLHRPFSMKQLERYILLANDLPGVDVKTVLSPSKTKIGGTDLTFLVTQKRLDGSVNYNNYGTRYIGPHQLGANLQVNSVFGQAADALSAFYTATPAKTELRTYGFNYVRPIGLNGLTTNISATMTKTRPNFPIAVLSNGFTGDSKEFEVDLNYPLIRSRLANLTLQAKFDWLNTNMNVAGLADNIFFDRIRSLRLGATYEKADRWYGVNSIGVLASHGFLIGGATNNPSDTQSPSRTGARSDYTKLNLDLSRWQSLKNQWSFLVSLHAQYTNDSLLSSEEIGFGGQNFGRGYDAAEISGDRGFVGKFELRKDTDVHWKLLKTVQYYGFYDAGLLWNVNYNQTDQLGRISGTSIGLGAHLKFGEHFGGDIELAKPLTLNVAALQAAGYNPKGARVFFNLVGMF